MPIHLLLLCQLYTGCQTSGGEGRDESFQTPLKRAFMYSFKPQAYVYLAVIYRTGKGSLTKKRLSPFRSVNVSHSWRISTRPFRVVRRVVCKPVRVIIQYRTEAFLGGKHDWHWVTRPTELRTLKSVILWLQRRRMLWLPLSLNCAMWSTTLIWSKNFFSCWKWRRRCRVC